MKSHYTILFAFLFLGFSGFSQTLDPTFGTGGQAGPVISGFRPSNLEKAMTLQPDGKIVVAGYYHNGSNNDFAVMRLNGDGTVDNSFDGDGLKAINIGYDDYAYAIAVQPDGKIVLTGYSYYYTTYSCNCSGGWGGGCSTCYNYYYYVVVVRLNADGSLDNTFAGDGISIFDFSASESAYSIALQSDGKIIIGGFCSGGALVARLNSNGSLDGSFNGTGYQIGNYASYVYSVTIQDDNKIVVVGYGTGSNTDFAIARFNTNGTLDNSFDGDGKKLIAIGSNSDDIAFSVVVQADQKIIIAGRSYDYNNTSTSYDFAIIRINSDGTLDNGFDGDGKKVIDFNTNFDDGRDVLIQNDGKILISGLAYNNASSYDMAIARLNPDGSLDNSFDVDGKFIHVFPGYSDYANSLIMQPDGKLLAGPYADGYLEIIRVELEQVQETLNCPESVVIDTDQDLCTAVVNNIDPIVSPANAVVNYKLEKDGVVIETGVGSVSGKTFDLGVTTVTYTLASDETVTCSFTVTVNDITQPIFICPSNQNVNLNTTCQLIIPNLISGLTGSDNCGTVTFTQSPLAGASLASSHNQTHNVVITASDGHGNTQTCAVILTGKDVTKPTLTCPGNQNINLNAICLLIVPNLISGLTGSDNCGTVTFTQTPVAGALLASSHNQTHNVLVTASDGNDNTQTCTVILTGKDVTQPTFSCPSNQNVNLNGSCQLFVPNLISGLTGSDNCGTVTFTQSPLAGASLASSHNQTHNVVITASDGNGNTQTCTVVLTGRDVTNPTFICPGNQNVNVNANCQLVVPNLIAGLTGSDNCGNVTFTQNPVAGALVASSHNQTHNILITASDGNGNITTCTTILTAKDITPPVINCQNDVTLSADPGQCGVVYTFGSSSQVLANAVPTINFVGSSGFTKINVAYNPIKNLYYLARGGSSNLPIETFSASGSLLFATSNSGHDWRGLWWNPSANQLEGNPCSSCPSNGIRKQDLNASGYALGTGTNILPIGQPDFQSKGTYDNVANEILYYNAGFIYRYSHVTGTFISSYAITGLPVSVNNLMPYYIGFTGVPGKELIVYDLNSEKIYFINKSTGAYVAACQLPPIATTVDPFWCIGYANGQIFINDGGSPTVYGFQIITASSLGAVDNCSSVTIIQTEGLPNGSVYPVGATINTFLATDAAGNTSTCSFTVTVNDNQNPTFNCPSDQNINLSATCQLIVPDLISGLTGSDNCGTVTFTQSPFAGASLASAHNQTHNVVIIASDGNGNTQSCTVVLTGKDVTKPTFICPNNQNVNLNGTCQLIVPNLITELTGSDNCGTVTFTQSPVAGSSLASSHNQTHNVLITASDGNGNTQTCTVVLTGKDVTKPTFTCPDDQNVNLNATCQLIVPNLIAELTGSDNCGTVTFTQNPLAGASLASSHNQTHNVVITANDGNGNTQTCTVVLTGRDVTKPTFICPDNQNVSLNGACQLIVPNLIAGLTGGDNCGTVTFTQSPAAGLSLASSHNQMHNVLITANDGNGNIQTCTVVLTGKDVTEPTFTCPDNKNVNLNGTCQLIVPNLIAGLTGSDNCGTVTFMQSPVAGASFSSSHNQTQNVVITASDGNGNTQSCTVILTAKDITLPVITCPSAKTISCDASILPANTGSATTSDNCGGNPVITYSDISGQDPNPSHAAYYNYTITRTWKAKDAAGNTNTCNQTITVQDVTDPDITCPPDKLNIPFDFGQLYATIALGSATATDNCASNANITIAGLRSDNVAITNQQYPLGQATVAWTATDPSDNSDGCIQTITVRKRNTAVTYTGDMIDNKICVQYSDIINLQAKLTDNEGLVTPNNISGRTITFQLLSGTTVLRSKSAITNSNGIAVDTFKIEQAPGLYSVKTIFTGDAYFNGSTDQDNCEVKEEDAIVEYNGSQYFTTASSTTLVGSITLAASLNDISDGSDKRGDIRKAKATFRDGGPGGTVLGSANLPVGLVNPGVLTDGLAATTQNNITLNSNDASSGGKIFQVWVGASDHYTGADAGPTPVTLALPGQDFVTGGGHLVVTNSAGTYAGTLNSKMNFGFTMKWNKSGKNLQGNINIVFRKWQLYNDVWQWRVYQAKSNAINSMAVVEVGANGQAISGTNPAAFRKAIINTKANLKDVTDPLNNIDLGGNHNLVLDAWDHITANGGVSDKISVTLMGSTTNELLFSSSWISNATAAQTITGGNINVRNGSLNSGTSINTMTKSNQMEATVKEDEFVVKAYPNPTNNQFSITISSNLNGAIVIQLYDAAGRKIQTMNATANETIRFGEKLKAGIYIAKVIQGNKQESIRLIKQ